MRVKKARKYLFICFVQYINVDVFNLEISHILILPKKCCYFRFTLCACVYTGAHLNTHIHTHACRLVAWHMRIKFWASTWACVCVCCCFFFLVCSPWCAQSEGAAVVAAWVILRQLLKFVYQTHTHTRTYACLYFVKRCAAVTHTHTHTRLARALNANDAIFGWASTFRSLLRLATYLSVSVTLTIYCYCDNVCAVYAILLARLHKRHFNEAPRLLFIFLHIAY